MTPVSRVSLLLGLILLLCLAFMSDPATCQHLRGTVLSAEDRSPINLALVKLIDLETGRTLAEVTDSSGAFLAHPLPGRANRLEVSALGYLTHIDTVYAGPQGDSLSLEIRLGVDAIPVDPLLVVASKRPVWESTEPKFLWDYFERKEMYARLGTGSRFYDRAALNGRVGTEGSLSRLESLWPLVSGTKKYVGCFGTTYFFDGLPWTMEGDPLRESPWQVGNLAGVEIYYGIGVPAEFITGRIPPCRVMAIWTQKSVIPEEPKEDEPKPYFFLPIILLAAILLGF